MKALPWETLGSEVRYTTRIFKLRKDRVRSPHDGKVREYDVIEAPGWVNVIPLTAEGRVVLVRQYRPGTREVTLEIPGGMVDPGEEPIEAARRELAEETGYQAEKFELLGVVEPNPAIQNNLTHTFLARPVRPTQEPRPEEDEQIEVLEAPLQELAQLLRCGEIRHSLVVAAFAHLALHGLFEFGGAKPA